MIEERLVFRAVWRLRHVCNLSRGERVELQETVRVGLAPASRGVRRPVFRFYPLEAGRCDLSAAPGRSG